MRLTHFLTKPARPTERSSQLRLRPFRVIVQGALQLCSICYPLFVLHVVHSLGRARFSFPLEVYRLSVSCCLFAR
jgi:hypothetical protein